MGAQGLKEDGGWGWSLALPAYGSGGGGAGQGRIPAPPQGRPHSPQAGPARERLAHSQGRPDNPQGRPDSPQAGQTVLWLARQAGKAQTAFPVQPGRLA